MFYRLEQGMNFFGQNTSQLLVETIYSLSENEATLCIIID